MKIDLELQAMGLYIESSVEKIDIKAKEKIDAYRHGIEDRIKRIIGIMGTKDKYDLYKQVIAYVERPLIEEVLRRKNGNKFRTAKALGIDRATLRKKMKLYRLDENNKPVPILKH